MALATCDWFQSNDSSSRLFAPLRDLNDNKDQWSFTALSVSSDEEIPTLPSVTADSVLYQSTYGQVRKQIDKLKDDATNDLRVEAAGKLSLTTKSLKDWQSDRKATRLRRTSVGLQEVISTIGDFLDSFSGIAEIVKGADQQYGGLAYGTISLLVSVAVHKQKREEAIQEAMEELSHTFPRLETLQRLKPKESLRKLVVDVFDLIVLFCREAIDYFAGRQINRLAQALSPKALKMETLKSLRTKLLEIRKESEIIMLEQLAEMTRRLQRIEKVGGDTNRRVRKSEIRDNLAQLADLREMLGLKRPQNEIFPQTDICHCHAVLTDEFSEHQWRKRRLRQLSWERLKQDKKFSDWKAANKSSLLFLGGSNGLEDCQTQLNWLSHASVLVAEQMHRERREKATTTTALPSYVLFVSCQWNYAVGTRTSFSDVVCHLINQLAEQTPDSLITHTQDISDAMQSPDWRDDLPGERFAAMASLLMKLIAALDHGSEITIILDRLDRCRWSEHEACQWVELEIAVRSLLDVVRSCSLARDRVRMKMLLIMDGEPAEFVAKKLAVQRGRSVEWRTGWDQEVDEDLMD